MGLEEELKELNELKDVLQSLSGEETTAETYGKVIEDLEIMALQNESKELKIVTKFTNNSNNEDPFYSKEGDSGFDLRAFLDAPITLTPCTTCTTNFRYHINFKKKDILVVYQELDMSKKKISNKKNDLI